MIYIYNNYVEIILSLQGTFASCNCSDTLRATGHINNGVLWAILSHDMEFAPILPSPRPRWFKKRPMLIHQSIQIRYKTCYKFKLSIGDSIGWNRIHEFFTTNCGVNQVQGTGRVGSRKQVEEELLSI